MKRFPVPHPEVDETLYVTECVIRMPCPQCKVAAGIPCKGARFQWMQNRGERRGFRYVQDAHSARQNLFRDWKRNGSPARMPDSILQTYEVIYGKSPKKLDVTSRAPTQGPSRKPRASKPKKKVAGRAESFTILHRGCLWEGLVGNRLTSWLPYKHRGDYSACNVFEHGDLFTLHTPGTHHRHELPSQIAAFDLAIDLVQRRELLRVFNARAEWRVQELERRFGMELSSAGS